MGSPGPGRSLSAMPCSLSRVRAGARSGPRPPAPRFRTVAGPTAGPIGPGILAHPRRRRLPGRDKASPRYGYGAALVSLGPEPSLMTSSSLLGPSTGYRYRLVRSARRNRW
ncbi:hypothetical protein GCM10018782_39690 [Streptomyces griseoaurantiacus]|nr:hypothetical protein GCM10018782_39690 [Streptomyces griseoaurantiacus]